MFATVQYTAANSVVRGRLAHLLTGATWQRLLQASNVEQILSVLDQTIYRNFLLDIPPQLERIEEGVTSYLVQTASAPLQFLQGQSHDFYLWFWRKFELDNILILLRGLHHGAPARQIQSLLIDLGNASKLDWETLSHLNSPEELIESLSRHSDGQFYATALDNAMDPYKKNHNIFTLEIALSRSYNRMLYKRIKKLNRRDRKDAERLVGIMLDARKLLWAWRFRDFFHLSPEEIVSYTLPRGIHVGEDLLPQIARGVPISGLVERIWPQMDRSETRKLAAQGPSEALVHLERMIDQQLYSTSRHLLRYYPFRLGTFLAYFFVLQSEAADLITILEGKATGRSNEEIVGTLIIDQRTSAGAA